MQITCTHCRREMTLADEKVPAKPFALTCPSCKGRVEVDPGKPDPGRPDPPPATAPSADEPQFEALPSLREIDKELLDALYPAAAVVNLTAQPAQPARHAEAGLKLLGMQEVSQFDDMTAAAEEMLESDFSIVVILLDRATAPPCEPLEPLYAVPTAVRRSAFVALLAENVRSLDGQTAFYLQVNCLINSQEIPKFPVYLRQALLYHQRRYRYWGIRGE